MTRTTIQPHGPARDPGRRRRRRHARVRPYVVWMLHQRAAAVTTAPMRAVVV
ncbi:hypothetical protein J4H86_21070 [Spiractinospora alimapuensis]|uniref:hypothetical protein n=1 Tax=Spiractinospora alimapuensis TaxID=2820884 RepID=UPI001F28615D|nr:hypothetical protein [Spiractinospora alimapuensis]QVQ51287.1 hypothetical protein J4H86_21070 [Spiractinospora alimapuensis]